MKMRITARLATVEKSKLDKLADKGVTVINCSHEPGFYIRLNKKTHRHAFGVVTPMRDGVKGANKIIGKLDDISFVDARKACREFYRNGVPMTVAEVEIEQASDKYTLDFCFERWLKKGKKKRSERTIAGVRRDLDLFSADWRERSVSDIETKEILARAEAISDGNIKSPNSEKSIGTYNVARRWLLSMSTIMNAAKGYHESFNRFESSLDDYPKDDGLQRTFTTQEIKTVIGFKESQTPRGPDMKPCPHKWLRMLALKFQLMSGFRIGDVIALRVDEIKHDGEIDYIEHHAGKGNRPHFLPVPAELKTILDQAEQARNSNPEMASSEFVFCSSTGSRFSNPRDSFDVARNILTDLELIKAEKVPGNGKRVIRSHDCRRTFKTVCIKELGIAESVTNSLLDHGESAMSKIYVIDSHEQRMIALARLLEDHSKYTQHLATR